MSFNERTPGKWPAGWHVLVVQLYSSTEINSDKFHIHFPLSIICHIHQNREVVSMTALVFTEDVESYLQYLLRKPEQSPWQSLCFSVILCHCKQGYHKHKLKSCFMQYKTRFDILNFNKQKWICILRNISHEIHMQYCFVCLFLFSSGIKVALLALALDQCWWSNPERYGWI